MLLYIRGGSIFARKDIARRSTRAMIYDPFTILVAVNEKGQAQGTLYVDDGESYDYQENKSFARIQFMAKFNENSLIIDVSVTGKAHLLCKNILQANRILLIQPSGHHEIPISFSLGENGTFKYTI